MKVPHDIAHSASYTYHSSKQLDQAHLYALFNRSQDQYYQLQEPSFEAVKISQSPYKSTHRLVHDKMQDIRIYLSYDCTNYSHSVDDVRRWCYYDELS